ncbi:signal recognition particle, SRP19 subunit [Pyronema omphalodes]|nr:signal recognition particle, SRP19 subunit [Pyronema omphalodes]
MSRHAYIEDADSDPEEIDISVNPDALDLDLSSNTYSTAPRFDRPQFTSRSAHPTGSTPAAPQNQGNPFLDPNLLASLTGGRGLEGLAGFGGPGAPAGPGAPQFLSEKQAQEFKHYQCLYPVYFDAQRSRQEGRKVAKGLAVKNPIAREIADACASLGLKAVYEMAKSHPKDWANPGRVKVLLKEDGEPLVKGIPNKFVLYQKVAQYLIAHPTQPETPLKVPVPGMPFDGKVPKPPVVPRGWKMGEILPLHSPALSGPGVTEDVFSQMMEGMGMGGLTGGPSAAPTGAPQIAEKKEKKDKKGKKK